MATVKHSKQREAILSELRSRKDHPTAEDLYFTLKAEMPNLQKPQYARFRRRNSQNQF